MWKWISERVFIAFDKKAIGFLALPTSLRMALCLVPQAPFDPTIIPKYVDPLPDPPELGKQRLTLRMHEFYAQILSRFDFKPRWI